MRHHTCTIPTHRLLRLRFRARSTQLMTCNSLLLQRALLRSICDRGTHLAARVAAPPQLEELRCGRAPCEHAPPSHCTDADTAAVVLSVQLSFVFRLCLFLLACSNEFRLVLGDRVCGGVCFLIPDAGPSPPPVWYRCGRRRPRGWWSLAGPGSIVARVHVRLPGLWGGAQLA